MSMSKMQPFWWFKKPPLRTILLWVNAFDDSLIEWVTYEGTDGRVGNSPYLIDTISDYVENYGNQGSYQAWEGIWDFEDMPSGTITSVKLKIYHFADAAAVLRPYIWNGSSWTEVGQVDNTGYPPIWSSFDVTSLLNTEAKVNGARLKLWSYQMAMSKVNYVYKAYLEVTFH